MKLKILKLYDKLIIGSFLFLLASFFASCEKPEEPAPMYGVVPMYGVPTAVVNDKNPE